MVFLPSVPTSCTSWAVCVDTTYPSHIHCMFLLKHPPLEGPALEPSEPRPGYVDMRRYRDHLPTPPFFSISQASASAKRHLEHPNIKQSQGELNKNPELNIQLQDLHQGSHHVLPLINTESPFFPDQVPPHSHLGEKKKWTFAESGRMKLVALPN